MILSAHQPAYLPWLGYFEKMAKSDAFCLLDTAQFSKGDFINRNRIKTRTGVIWLTVPVHSVGTHRICDVRISGGSWRNKHVNSIRHAYRNTPFYQNYAPELCRVLTARHSYLSELTNTLVRLISGWLGLEKRLIVASDYDFAGKKSEYILEICRRLGASSFLFGTQGRTYCDLQVFAAAGIEVRFQDYAHPVYRQRYGAFVPRLSIIDLLFNEGPRSLEILKQGALDARTEQNVPPRPSVVRSNAARDGGART